MSKPTSEDAGRDREVRETGTSGSSAEEVRPAATLPPDPPALGRPLSDDEKVDEALLESMDASDPPAYGAPQPGTPACETESPWRRVTFSPRAVRGEQAALLVSVFDEAYRLAGSPSEAAVFQSGVAFFFSPGADRLVGEFLASQGGKASERLTASGSVWVAGSRSFVLPRP